MQLDPRELTEETSSYELSCAENTPTHEERFFVSAKTLVQDFLHFAS